MKTLLRFQTAKWVFLAVFFAWAVNGPVYANVALIKAPEISTDQVFTGTLVLTYPDGRIEILEPGDEIPSIPSGSTLEIFDGHMRVVTQEGDSVSAGCLGQEFQVSNGASATISCGQQEGKIAVLSNFVTFVGEDGQQKTVAAPDVLPIILGQPLLPAAPTAAVESPGFAVDTAANPDSTSIEAPSPPAPPSTTPSS